MHIHGSDILILLVVMVVCIVTWYIMVGADRRRMKQRIDRIKQRKVSIPKTQQDVSLRRKTEESQGLVYWITKPLPDFKRLGDRLERAGKKITPKRYVFRRAINVLLIMVAFKLFLGKSWLLWFFVGIVLGVWLPIKWLQMGINKQNKAFLKLFPDAIDLIVRGLRSGLPVSESLVLVAQEVSDPVGGVFTNVSNTMKLGVPMEKALQETARKLDMTEFNFFTTSIILQRETGGNLSEILNNLSEVLRGRYIMRMKIRAMSSEARASAIIIGALPFVVLGAVSVLSPQYMKPLWEDYRGNICAAVAAGMMSSGMWIMYKMTQFEI